MHYVIRNSQLVIPYGLLACFSVVVPLVAKPPTPRVSITGGADVSGKNYSWVVTNQQAGSAGEHSSPIVSVEFPHYRAALFFAPDGWDTACTYLVNVGVPDLPGSCQASVEIAKNGIRPGQRETFRLGMAPRWAPRGRGSVHIRFADATEMVVTGVEVPQREDRGEKYMPLVGLIPMLMVAVWVRRRRARSNPPRNS